MCSNRSGGVPVACRSKPEEIRIQCWKRQIARGGATETMLDGVRRYARYLAATGKAGTEFVQRADDVFWPDRNFENPWLLPVSGTNNQRCVNHISEPDTEIPPDSGVMWHEKHCGSRGS